MKKCVILCIFLLAMYSNINGQFISVTDSIELHGLAAENKFNNYLQKIQKLGAKAFKSKDLYTINFLGEYLKKVDSDELDSQSRGRLRNTAMYFGHWIWKLKGYCKESLEMYLIAHENVSNKATLDSMAWYVENRIMNAYTVLGDYEKAEYFAKLLENHLIFSQKTELLSRFYTNKGRRLKSALKFNEAIDVFEKGYRIADSISFPEGILANALNLAELYNDYPALGSSEPYLLKAEEILPWFESENNYYERKSHLEIEKANFLSSKKMYNESILLYKAAIRSLTNYFQNTQRREFAKYYTDLGYAYLHVDSLKEAEMTIVSGLKCLIPDYVDGSELPQHSQLYSENTFVELFDLKSLVDERNYYLTGRTEFLNKALKSIKNALYVNDLIRESVIADPSKLINIQGNKDLIEKTISILYLLSNKETGISYYDQARELFNRSKSLLLSEKTRRNYLLDRLSVDDLDKWNQLQTKLIDLHQEKSTNKGDINVLNGEILSCQQEMDIILSGYEDVQYYTESPDQYIEYLETDENIYALSDINGLRSFVLIGSQEELRLLVKRLQDFILLKGLSMDEGILNDLYNFLIKPVSQKLPEHIIIIPDGSIGYIPIEMLKDMNGRYLIETTTVAYSFEYITIVDTSEKLSTSNKLFCWVPQYPAKTNTSRNEVSRGSIYHLPYAKLEGDSICSLFGQDAILTETSDKYHWVEAISGANLFHYAGHAIVEGDKAYLALTGSKDESNHLHATEIGLVHLKLDLVVLSACETGLGKLESGEGIRSLGRNFMESGAKATIISLWNVNDKSTASIMLNFYKYLKKEYRKDDALRLAKLEYIHKVSGHNPHPYFWAAFIPAGNMGSLIIRSN